MRFHEQIPIAPSVHDHGIGGIDIERSELYPITHPAKGLWLSFLDQSGSSVKSTLLSPSVHTELLAALFRALPDAEKYHLAAHLAQQFPDRRKGDRRHA